MLFSDPHKPIPTCIYKDCNGCPVHKTLHCHFDLRDLFHFVLIAIPSFILGGAGVYHVSGWLLIPWVLFVVAYFGFIEIRVMCSHCPHYAEPEGFLKCWANYGAPKIWKYRPGPMTFMEKVVFFSGFLIIWGYPLIFLVFGLQWFLLIVYVASTSGFFIILKTYLCSQCMNFACPLNAVDDKTRRGFFERNPDVAKAWDS